ncbi:MAG: imidazolonepropionase [Christensenellaceae bacterium]|nr:imidazolonepropionase [Christensenellaceae bacterium]
MLLIKNIGLLATPLGTKSLCGAEQGAIQKLHDAQVLIDDGRIISVTADGEELVYPADTIVIDAEGALVTPGLVDAHTHLVFGGWRAHEVPLKIAGASYLDILNAGGGILNTLTNTRNSTEDELYERSRGFLAEMLNFGVTTVEIKSGYGLNLEDELKQLRVIRRLGETIPQDIVSTFLGAHAIPDEFSGNADGYIDFIIEKVLPRVAEEKLADFCDVFLESSVFNVEQSRKLLLAAQKLGLPAKIHADEIDPLGGSELAGEIGAVSAEHLIATRDSGIEAMAKSKVTACLLPQTSLYLDKPFARARDMINAGVPVAIATDFNPGSCPSLNLQLSMNLGYLRYRMYPEEVLTAVTLNAACAIGKGEKVGSIEEGKFADLVIWKENDLPMLCYRMGSNQAKTVIKKGIVYETY